MEVNVHIHELVLHGLPAATAEALATEVRRAIEAQILQGAAWTSDSRRHVVDAGAVAWTSGPAGDLSAAIASKVSRAVLP